MAGKKPPTPAEAARMVEQSGMKQPRFQGPNSGPPVARKAARQAQSKASSARSEWRAGVRSESAALGGHSGPMGLDGAAVRRKVVADIPSAKTPEERMARHRASFAEKLGPEREFKGATPFHKPAMSTRGKVGLGVAAAGTIAAGGYGVHRYRSRKKAPVTKALINPYETFSKGTPANGLRMVESVYGNAGKTVPAPMRQSSRIKPRPSVKNGVRMVRDMKVNSKIPDGARKGSRIA